jgi:hypothetical protein
MNTKTCTKCKEEKPLTSFHKKSGTYDGLQQRCKTCRNEDKQKYRKDNPWQQKGESARFRAKNKKKIESYMSEYRLAYYSDNKTKWIEQKYGITLSDAEKMLEEQDYSCKICGDAFTESKNTHIDHCHATGIVRGLLCRGCNLGLGHFRDNPESLMRAASYLVDSNGASR